MPAMISMWEQAAEFDPTNPSQINHVRYAGIPGTYASYYYNRVPTTAQLNGLFDTLPDWATAGIVGLFGLGLGFFGARAYKKRKGKSLSGARHRRRY
jgi:hypothetical protein